MIVVFAGTTEGRELSNWLSKRGICHAVCVATEYGERIMQDSGSGQFMSIHEGRMNEDEMFEFIKKQEADMVIDATHPYATEVGVNILNAAQKAKVCHYRVRRESTAMADYEKIKYFSDAKDCAAYLAKTDGNILLTTGSKDLPVYAENEDVRKRLYARVLPGKEGIEACENCGISGKHIIAIQGPFSEELNLALIRQYGISRIVSKDSGKTGGTDEKISAAIKAGIEICMIGGKKEDAQGISLPEMERVLEQKYDASRSRKISIISCGMAGKGSLTGEAKAALDCAGIVFGAKRLLAALGVTQKSFPYYRAEEIIPELLKDSSDAAVLFSGDTGFYSGAVKFIAALKDCINSGTIEADIQIYAGVSSPAALAAAFGISWNDAVLMSLHGKNDPESVGEFIDAVKHERKVFTLLSGPEDIRNIASALIEDGLSDCRFLIGRNMGNDDEETFESTPEKCAEITESGLYSIYVVNDKHQPRPAAGRIRDDEFIRADVPMTKESIRTLSISKLDLKEDSIVYDIGSGTGSVSAQIALLSPKIRVYAIERKSEAVALSRENFKKMGIRNVKLIEAEAPDGLEDLPAPTHVFIGGSGGHLVTMLKKLFEKNPHVRIVITAVTLETLNEITQIGKSFDIEDLEILSISAAKARKLGSYHLMQSENPVWICSFQGKR